MTACIAVFISSDLSVRRYYINRGMFVATVCRQLGSRFEKIPAGNIVGMSNRPEQTLTGVMRNILEIKRKSPTLHDFPYSGTGRKCYHKWIVNVTPPGRDHCVHSCVYCYARDAVYSRRGEGQMEIYSNISEVVEKELESLRLCPPICISNVTDPCQDVPALKKAVLRLVGVLVRRGVSFHLITKGDPSFLEDVEDFPGRGRFFLEVTVEGPPEILKAVSPLAPPYEARMASIGWAKRNGLPAVLRLDPVIYPLYEAMFGEKWCEAASKVMEEAADRGAGHVVVSTGRLSPSALRRLALAAESAFPGAGERITRLYRFERGPTSCGMMLPLPLRRDIHEELRDHAESLGLTYAVCQELPPGEGDSPGLPHCEAFPMPFSVRVDGGSFLPVEGCTANCHLHCAGKTKPPCGFPELGKPEPYRPSLLRLAPPRRRSFFASGQVGEEEQGVLFSP